MPLPVIWTVRGRCPPGETGILLRRAMQMSTNDHNPKGTGPKVHTPAAGAPRPPDTYATQRRGTRVLMQDPAPIQLHLRAADLLDISLSGAFVEHTVGVRVGEVYRLFFPVEGVEVEVLARAVRSFVSRVAPVAGGEGRIVYRTGLEFIELKESMAKTLSAYIDDLNRKETGKRSAQPAAPVPQERMQVSNKEHSNTGVAPLPGGRGKAVPANQLTRAVPERRAWNRWSLAGILILGSVLVSSLLYVTGTPTIKPWSPPLARVTGDPGPVAAMANTGGEPSSGLLSRTGEWAESELARLGLLSAPQGPMMPAPSESVAAHVLSSFGQPMQAGAGPDLWPPLSDLSSILGLRASLPQWPPVGVKGDSQPGVTEITVAPAHPHPPAEFPVSQEANVTSETLSEWPVESHTSNLLTALPPAAPTRPESSSVPTLREKTRPSRRVQPTPESPSPRQDKAAGKVATLRGVDLRGSDLRGANLQGADLTGARLAWARLTGAKLQGATLHGADLTEADLWMADLRGADLQNADLRGAKLTPGGQAATEGEAASEAIAMVRRPPGAPSRDVPAEMVVPRRIVPEEPRETEPR
jgi:hypothetical protein